MTNILILSAGTRNKVVQYFKEAFAGVGRVIAADMSELAPAVYEADAHYLVPRITAPDYMERVLEICRREQICGVLSLIDPELSLLAANQAAFRAIGVTVIGSSKALCDRSLDKFQMYQWLKEHGYPCAASYTDMEAFARDRAAGQIDFPVFVKPICGSASMASSKVEDAETLEFLMKKNENLMVQTYLNGQEIGADVYVDMLSGKVISIFTKRKLAMRAGETDKAVSFRDERLLALIERFVCECGYRGQVDIDLFEVDGAYYISEVNPRFGGGYPHAHACGCDHVAMIRNNLCGVENIPRIGAYEEGVCMMKYSEIMVKKQA